MLKFFKKTCREASATAEKSGVQEALDVMNMTVDKVKNQFKQKWETGEIQEVSKEIGHGVVVATGAAVTVAVGSAGFFTFCITAASHKILGKVMPEIYFKDADTYVSQVDYTQAVILDKQNIRLSALSPAALDILRTRARKVVMYLRRRGSFKVDAVQPEEIEAIYRELGFTYDLK